jgi:hypothetical protein
LHPGHWGSLSAARRKAAERRLAGQTSPETNILTNVKQYFDFTKNMMARSHLTK